MNLLSMYETLCGQESDINEHLPTLMRYAKSCNHITEFGTRTGKSTIAILASCPAKMITYDILLYDIKTIIELAKKNLMHFEYRIIDVLKIKIEETDLLFIDTEHTYKQLSQELKLHGNKARKYLIFHDTTTFECELWPAITEFMERYPHWKLEKRYTNNNGLTILKRG